MARDVPMFELNRLMKSSFGTNCMPPKSSGAILLKTSMFIYGKNNWSVKSRLRSLNFSTFPLRSPMTSTQGSQGSSSSASLEAMLRLPIALNIVSLNYQKIL
jgi:hypothetical protein